MTGRRRRTWIDPRWIAFVLALGTVGILTQITVQAAPRAPFSATSTGASPSPVPGPTITPSPTGSPSPSPSSTPSPSPSPTPTPSPGGATVPGQRTVGLVAATVQVGPGATLAYAGTETVRGRTVLRFVLTGTATFDRVQLAFPCDAWGRFRIEATAPAGSVATLTGAAFDATGLRFSIGAQAFGPYSPASPPDHDPTDPFPISGKALLDLRMTGVLLAVDTASFHGLGTRVIAC
jgi:hypothetical protein